MKGTEVPNPWRSSACDVLVAMRILFCSCLCTVCSKVSDSLMLCAFYLAFSSAQFAQSFHSHGLPCALFCSCLCKVFSQVSDTLSQVLILADFTLSSLPRTKWPLATWSRFICMCVFRGVESGQLIM